MSETQPSISTSVAIIVPKHGKHQNFERLAIDQTRYDDYDSRRQALFADCAW
jgi:hypothetical protein